MQTYFYQEVQVDIPYMSQVDRCQTTQAPHQVSPQAWTVLSLSTNFQNAHKAVQVEVKSISYLSLHKLCLQYFYTMLRHTICATAVTCSILGSVSTWHQLSENRLSAYFSTLLNLLKFIKIY